MATTEQIFDAFRLAFKDGGDKVSVFNEYAETTDDEQIKETNSSNINADFSAWSMILGLENEEIDTKEFCDYREHYENIYFSNYYFYGYGKYYFVSDRFVEDAIKFILDDDLDDFCKWLLENYNEEISYWLEDDE